jgi:N-acetylglutamate synthase-like GNAT family acetyltransferase
MLISRKARPSDVGAIGSICDALDFDDLSESLAGVYVLEGESGLLGLLRIGRYGDVCYLSEVGIIPNRRHEGLGSRLLDDVLKGIDWYVYLYTVIPDYFDRFGFEVVAPPTSIPTRAEIDCEGCEISKCRCMVRKTNDS